MKNMKALKVGGTTEVAEGTKEGGKGGRSGVPAAIPDSWQGNSEPRINANGRELKNREKGRHP